MLHDAPIHTPRYYQEIKSEGEKLKFNMISDLHTGSFLRTLAASKPGGNFLELGTGTGLSLAWLAEGADSHSRLVSIDNDSSFQAVAQRFFGDDKRIRIACADGAEWLREYKGDKFDLIFADAWPGKFEVLEQTLALVKVGGFYFIDDLLPQPNWPDKHAEKVEALIKKLTLNGDFRYTTFSWSTGLILFTRIK